ncbi:MAG: 3-phosphoshikimate 1-carboxyvinyltransferase [Prevotella sp.]|jgi:3-phosphoshikimate 1-carboxyvinyltransferase|nr:3-phosphoshikimate 1-carboxyvinyltransferase [Prevotella sp.]
MKYKINAPELVHSSIKLPASKSISNRALILNALSAKPNEIDNLSDCDDTQVMIDAFASESNIFDVKAAGTSMRFLTAFLAMTPGEWLITGTKRMKERPIHLLVDALNSLGAKIDYTEQKGFPPLKIKGGLLKGGEIRLAGNVSSQFISALLMVAPTMEKGLTIHLDNDVISVPYIKLTLKMMEEFGAKSNWTGNTIKVFPQEYKSVRYCVESDWSAASYWYEIVALSEKAEVELTGLRKDSGQGDSKVAELFADLGVETTYTDRGVLLRKTDRTVKKMFCDFLCVPDLAQTLVVTCCMKNIPFLFTGLQSLKIKETDRIEALKAELHKLGYAIADRNNSILEWDGERSEAQAEPVIETYEDHRMAMAFAPAAIKAGALSIAKPNVVTKSYPRYWDDLKKAGFVIEEI